MSQAVSPATGKPYGVQRAGAVLYFVHSSFYLRQAASMDAPHRKRGSKPKWSYEELLDVIIHDLARSEFHGEGHRKMWERLMIMDGVRVRRKRTLRVMR